MELEEDKYRIRVNFNTLGILIILAAVSLGYLECGTKGAFAGLAVSALGSLLAILGYVPFIGFLLYRWIMLSYVKPVVFSKCSIPVAWSIAYYANLAIAIVTTAVVTIAVIIWIMERVS